MNESTARNIRVQDRYDELMRIGRHGHYETMFQVVREEIESLRQQLASCDAEIERLKTVPMRYRRMAFNAQLQDENTQLRQQLDHIKEVDFPRKVEAVSNGWRTRLDAERIVAKERFERLLSWVDDYCEVDDKDFVEIEPVVNAVLGEAIETNPLSDLRKQLAALKSELKTIGKAVDDPRTDLTMTMSEVIIEFKQQLAAALAAIKVKDKALEVANSR